MMCGMLHGLESGGPFTNLQLPYQAVFNLEERENPTDRNDFANRRATTKRVLYQYHILNVSKTTRLSEISPDNLFQNLLHHHSETGISLLT